MMAGGIAAYFALPFEPSAAWFAASPLLAILTFAARRHLTAQPLLAALLAFALGFNAAQLETSLIKSPLLAAPTEPVSVIGTLIRAEAMPEGSRLTLKSPWIKDMPREERPKLIRVKVRTPFEDLPESGARVNIWGPLWPPADPALPGGYDFRRQAFFKQIGATGLSYVELREREARYPTRFFWDGFHLLFEKARRALTLMTFAQIQNPEEKAMTAALLSGSQTAIDDDTMQAMRASGLSHLLSISGVHVSMMALLVYVPLRFLLALFPWIALRFSIKKWAAATAIIATSLYTLLVGADAPTVRSALMTGLVMFAIMMDRKSMSLRLVALAALAIMLTTPSAVMGASFQMSFAAVLAMVAAYEKRLDATLGFLQDPTISVHTQGTQREQHLPFGFRRCFHYLKDIILTSLIATGATTPFTIFHFQTFNFYGVIANMLAIPLTTLWVMPCLLLTYIGAPFGATAWALDGAGWGVGIIIDLARAVAAWPFAQLYLPPLPAWALFTFLVGGFWLCLWQGRWRYAGLLPIALTFFYPLTVTTPDVFIDADAPVWAVHLSDGTMAAYGKRDENFTIAQWRQQSGNPAVAYYSARKLPDYDKDLFCDGDKCLYEKGNVSIMFLMPPKMEKEKTSDDVLIPPPHGEGKRLPLQRQEQGRGENDWEPKNKMENTSTREPPPTCPTTTITVAFIPMPPCPNTIMIDRAALDKGGAHTITLTPNAPPLITAVRQAQGLRPWSVGWKTEDRD